MAKNDSPPAAAAPVPAPEANAKPAAPTNKTLWMGTAVGVGSAALVAALLYAKRR